MTLIASEDIITAVPLLNFPGWKFFASLLLKLMKFNKINSHYDRLHRLSSGEFIDSVIEILGFRYELAEEELGYIQGKEIYYFFDMK
jgi:hypothetical protein